MKTHIRQIIPLALLLCGCQSLHGVVTVAIDGGDPIFVGNSSPTFVSTGTFDDGVTSTTFTVTMVTSGTVGNEETGLETPGDRFLRTKIRDVAGANNQTNWLAQFTVDFANPIDGLQISAGINAPNVADDVDWSVAWTGAATTADLINVSASGLLYEPSPSGVSSSPLASGIFNSGDSWRYDRGPGAEFPNDDSAMGTGDWYIELPGGISPITFTADVHDLSLVRPGTYGFGEEAVALDFTNATIVPEPGAVVLLLSAVPLMLLRRRQAR